MQIRYQAPYGSLVQANKLDSDYQQILKKNNEKETIKRRAQLNLIKRVAEQLPQPSLTETDSAIIYEPWEDDFEFSTIPAKSETSETVHVTLITGIEEFVDVSPPEMTEEDLKMLRAHIFVLTCIEKEYPHSSPEKSDLYQLICAFLNINKQNPLTNNARLHYLTEFLNDVENSDAFDNVGDKWKTKEDLINAIKQRIDAVFKKLMHRFNQLISNPPTPAATLNKANELEKKYMAATSSRWFTNKKRLYEIDFIRFIETTCKDLYENPLDEKAYMARMGAHLFVALEANSDTYWNSVMRKFCLDFLHAGNISEIDLEEREMELKALVDHIARIDKSAYKDNQLLQNKKQWNLMESQLFRHLSDTKKKFVYHPSLLNRGISNAAYFTIHQVVGKIVLPSVAGAVLAAGIAGTGGALGFFVLGPLGAIVAVQLFSVAEKKVYDFAMLKGLPKFTRKIGDIGEGACLMVVAFSEAQLKKMLGRDKAKDDFESDQQALDTFRRVPSYLFPKQNKAKLDAIDLAEGPDKRLPKRHI